MKEISSPYTFFYKYIFLLFWLLGFGFAMRERIFFAESYDARWLQYTAVWLGFGLFVYLTSGPIKKVVVEGDSLVVSNYLRTERIALSQIVSVDGSAFLSPRLVWLELREESPFGKKITFLPRHRMSAGLGKHPLVTELRQELGL